MPILVVVARRYGIRSAVALAASATLLYRLAVNRYVGGALFWAAPADNSEYRVLLDWTAGRWIEFGLGMWAAALVADRREVQSRIPFGLLSGVLLLSGDWVRWVAREDRLFDVFLFGMGFFC